MITCHGCTIIAISHNNKSYSHIKSHSWGDVSRGIVVYPKQVNNINLEDTDVDESN